MAFRGEVEALKARAESLERELAEARSELDDAREKAARSEVLERRVRELEELARRSWRAGDTVPAGSDNVPAGPSGTTPSSQRAQREPSHSVTVSKDRPSTFVRVLAESKKIIVAVLIFLVLLPLLWVWVTWGAFAPD